jgi:hypothetical protein
MVDRETMEAYTEKQWNGRQKNNGSVDRETMEW